MKKKAFASSAASLHLPRFDQLAGGDVAAGGGGRWGGGGQQPQGRAQAARQAGGGLGQTIAGIVRMAVFWYFAAKFFGPKRPPAEPGMLMSNLFQKGEPLVRTRSLHTRD